MFYPSYSQLALLLVQFPVGLALLPIYPNGVLFLQEEDLLDLLQDKENAEDKLVQTDISEEDLERILDRSDLFDNSTNGDRKAIAAADAFPLKGPGWEVMKPSASGGMLSTLNS